MRPSLSSTSNFSPPSTTWWLVRIQPLLSKMTPDPTPVSGMTPLLPAFAVPVTVMRTTAGLTLAATAIVADDSSMATGWTVPTLVACGALAEAGAGRSSAPTADSAATVPTDASTADSTDASDQRAASAAGALRCLDGRGRWGRRGRLVPAFRGDGRALAPRAGPIGARLGARGVAGGRAGPVRLDRCGRRPGRAIEPRLGGIGRGRRRRGRPIVDHGRVLVGRDRGMSLRQVARVTLLAGDGGVGVAGFVVHDAGRSPRRVGR